MEIAYIIALVAAVAVVGFFIRKRSRSEIRSVNHFKTELEKISPNATPEVSSKPTHRAEERDRTADPAHPE